MRVAVVGGGAAGLVMARWLMEEGGWEEVVLFEQASGVGGTWVYCPVKDSAAPVFSSMYRDLISNLPRHVMSFLDEDFPGDLPTFVGHEAVVPPKIL